MQITVAGVTHDARQAVLRLRKAIECWLWHWWPPTLRSRIEELEEALADMDETHWNRQAEIGHRLAQCQGELERVEQEARYEHADSQRQIQNLQADLRRSERGW